MLIYPNASATLKLPRNVNFFLFWMMKCISWNIRGVESLDRKHVMKRFLYQHRDVDLVMLQEVKAIKFILEVNLRFIRKEACQIVTNHEKGKGRVVFLINGKWRSSIVDDGSSPCNKAV